VATLFYAAFVDAVSTALGGVVVEDTIAISGAAANSDPLPGVARERYKVRIMCDVDAFVTWDNPPILAKSDGTEGRPVGAENPEYFDIEAGMEISVIERI
jgi:hypothetical protein